MPGSAQKFITTKTGQVVPIDESKGGGSGGGTAAEKAPTPGYENLDQVWGEALMSYQYGSSEINGLLRGTWDPENEDVEMDIALQANYISEAIQSYRLTAPVKVWRGADLGDADPTTLVGKTYSDKAFMSTSLDERVASKFLSDAERPCLLHIHLPKGHHAIDMTKAVSVASEGRFDVSNEREILLNREGRFRVESSLKGPATPHSRGKEVWHVHLVPLPEGAASGDTFYLADAAKPKFITKGGKVIPISDEPGGGGKSGTAQNPQLSSSESALVRAWVEGRIANEINELLRDKGQNPSPEDKALYRKADQLSGLIQSQKLSAPTALYRGIDTEGRPELSHLADLDNLVGKAFKDEGFLATSTNSHQAGMYGRSYGSAQLVFHCPAGHNAFFTGKRGIYREEEVILDRGQSWKIERVEEGDELEVLTPEYNRAWQKAYEENERAAKEFQEAVQAWGGRSKTPPVKRDVKFPEKSYVKYRRPVLHLVPLDRVSTDAAKPKFITKGGKVIPA